MKKLICLCAVLWIVSLLSSQAFAADFSAKNTTIDFTGELPEVLQPAFSGPEWDGYHVEVGQWRYDYYDTITVCVVMQKEAARTLCVLQMEDGQITNFVTSPTALYPDRVPAFESELVSWPYHWSEPFSLVYHNQDGTIEKFHFTEHYSEAWEEDDSTQWIVDNYTVERQGIKQLSVDITKRTLEFGKVSVFNVCSPMLPEFNITQFPTTLERAQELAASSPEALSNTALTIEWEAPLRERPAADAVEVATWFDGVTVHLLDSGDEDWAHVRVSNLEGYMLREHLAFGIDKVNMSPSNGGYGYVAGQESLPVRQHPASDSSVLGEIPTGGDVRVLGITHDEQWVSVLYKKMNDSYGEMNVPYGEKNDGTFDDVIMGFVPASSIFMQIYHVRLDDLISADDPHTLLALHAAPNTSAELIGEYYNGMFVNHLFTSHAIEGWQRVEIQGITGYVQTENLYSFCAGCGDDFPYLPPLVTVKAAGEGAKLYPEPSDTSAPIGIYPEGSGIEVMGVIGEWGHVHAQDGQYGFMQLSALGGKPDSAESTQYKLLSEITLFNDPSDNAKTGEVLLADTVITLTGHGFDRWHTPYDYETGYGESQWVDRDWVYISENPYVGGYVRWSELVSKIEPAVH